MIAPTRMPKPPVLGRRRRSRSPTVGICGTTSRRQWRKRLQPNTIASERSPILSLDPRSNAPHRNNGGRPPTRFTSPVRRVRYLPSARNCDSRRPQLSRTKARESDRSPGRLGWRGKPSAASTTQAVSMNCLARPGPASPLCWTSSPRTCTRASTTDAPPLLHFTKNFKRWDIVAATVPSAAP